MGDNSFSQLALKEAIVWFLAALAGYVTFTSFETTYGKARAFAAEVGFAHPLFGTANYPVAVHYDAKVTPGFDLNLRGTVKGHQETPVPPPSHRVILSANGYGHFHAEAEIGGQNVEFMTDTGATYVALSYETALKMGLIQPDLHFSGRSTTANGVAKVASVMLDNVRIGEISVHNVQAVIAEPGRMTQNLLGMSFISKLSGFELSGNKLAMTE